MVPPSSKPKETKKNTKKPPVTDAVSSTPSSSETTQAAPAFQDVKVFGKPQETKGDNKVDKPTATDNAMMAIEVVPDTKVEITPPSEPRKVTFSVPEIRLPKGPNVYGTFAALAVVSLAVGAGLYGWRMLWDSINHGAWFWNFMMPFVGIVAVALVSSLPVNMRYDEDGSGGNTALTVVFCIVMSGVTGILAAGLTWLIAYSSLGLLALALWPLPALTAFIAAALYGDFHKTMTAVESGARSNNSGYNR